MSARISASRPTTIALLLVAAAIAAPAFGQSASDCAARADRAARNADSALTGAVRGSIGGAAIGAIVKGNHTKGAKQGAAIGAVVGGAHGVHHREEVYKRTYDDCMRGY